MIFLSSNLYPFDQNYFVQLRWNRFSVWLPVTNALNCHSLYTAYFCNIGAWGMWACSLFLSLLSEHFPWNGLTDFHESVVMMNILCRWAHSQTIVHSFASFELRQLPRLISSLYLERPCVHLITVFANNFLPLVKHPNDINFFLILTSSFTFVCTTKSRDSNYCQV